MNIAGGLKTVVRLEPKTLTRRRCATLAQPPLRAPSGVLRNALIIGTSRHRHPPFSRLALPVFDLAGLHAVLTAPQLGGFEAPPPLCDQPAFDLNMELESFFRQRDADDLLLLYLAGHVLADAGGALSFITHGADRGRWRSSVIDLAFVRDLMGECGSERQLLILDGSIGAVGSDAPALGAPLDLGAALGGLGRVVLSASNRVTFRVEGDAVAGEPKAPLLVQRLVQGLRSGGAHLDGDRRASIDDLTRYASGAREPAVAPTAAAERRSSIAPEPLATRPGGPRRRSWASQAASSVASWLAAHVGL